MNRVNEFLYNKFLNGEGDVEIVVRVNTWRGNEEVFRGRALEVVLAQSTFFTTALAR